MTTEFESRTEHRPKDASGAGHSWQTAFGYARNFLSNRFVYVVISPRAGGLSLGVNMNPDRKCNFDCVYCEVDRRGNWPDLQLDVPRMVEELNHTLGLAAGGGFRQLPAFQNLPDGLLELRQVVLSGDGEPTLCPSFRQAVQSIVHLRALGHFPFFKLALVTNATNFQDPEVAAGIKALSSKDDVWAKLDAGAQTHFERINRPEVPYEQVLDNILWLGRQRPIVVQSLFPRFGGREPSTSEVEEYVSRLRHLVKEGAQISLVQIYSSLRPTMHPDCEHLSLKALSRIAQTVRTGTGLRVEVY